MHYGIPKSFELYHKQIKNGAVDREPCRCILYYDNLEEKKNKLLISKKTDTNIEEKTEELRELTKIIDFCEEKYECRRELLLSYFNEKFTREKCYNMCDNCNKNIYREKVDCRKECKIILGLLNELKNKSINFTIEQLIDYLIGINKDNNNKNNKNFFGELSNYTKDEINKMIRYLIIKEYIDEFFITKNSLTLSSLKINNFGERIYQNINICHNNDVVMKISVGKIYNKENIKNKNIFDDNAYDDGILNQKKSVYHIMIIIYIILIKII